MAKEELSSIYDYTLDELKEKHGEKFTWEELKMYKASLWDFLEWKRCGYKIIMRLVCHAGSISK